ncbi:MAG: CotH kinase family protein [Lachnospiraceae bacterium]|nr:CotH kinase family protein [Lachnospiraceae bacterium]
MPGGDGSFNPGDMFGGDGNFNPGDMFGGDGNFNPGDMFGGDGNSNSNGSNDNDTEGSGNGGFNFDPNNIPNGGDGTFNFDPNNIPGGGDGSFNPGSMPGGNGDFNPGNMPGGNDESNPGKITGNVGGFSLVSSTSSNTDSSNGSDFDPNNIPSNGDGSFSFDPSNMPSSGDGSFSFDPSNMPESSDGSFSFDFSNMPNMGGGNGGGGGFSKSGGGANLNYTDDELDSYQTIWDSAITGTSTADRRRVVTALKNISEGNDLETYLDVDNVLKYMAVHTFSVNMDSLSGSMSHNYYLYEYDGQLNILPWDYNLSLGGMSMGSSGNASDMINDAIDTPFSGTHFFDTLLENEEYLAKYHEYLQQLVDEYVNGGRFDEVYNRIRSQIDDLVAADPTAFYNYEEYQTGAEMLYQTIKLRAESIDGQIKGTIPSTDEGQRQDSSTLIDASSIDVTAMGQFNMGGNFGSFKVRSNRNKRGSSSDEETTTEESVNSSTGSDSSSTGDSEKSSGKTKDSSERSRSGKSGFSRPGSSSKGNGSSSDNSGASDNAESNADTDSSGSDNMPDMSNFDSSNMPDMSNFDSSNMPDMSSFDSSNMPDMSNFNSGNMSDMGSFNPGSGSFPGSSSSQGRLSNIILYAVCFVIMIAALIIIRFSSRKRFKRGISNSAVS